MSQVPNDDLFKETTMSFGEHLEELRVSLFRAMAGLVGGTVIALLIAHLVVDAIQGPLKKALDTYYLDKAETDLLKHFVDTGQTIPSPEELALIREKDLVPTELFLDAEEYLRALKKASPEQFGDLDYIPHRYVSNDIRAKDVRQEVDYNEDQEREYSRLCQRLKQGEDDQKQPAGLLWRLLTRDQQRAVVRIADEDSPSNSDITMVLSILNELAEKPEIPNSTEFLSVDGIVHSSSGSSNPVDWLKALFAGQDVFAKSAIDTVIALKEKAKPAADGESDIEPDELRRLNKLLIASAMPDVLNPPQRLVLEVESWKRNDIRVQTLNAQEAFMIWLKAALITGFVITSPWIFWQVWHFVAAGLYPHEKSYVYIYLPFSLILFLCGTGLAFFFVFEPVLDFLFSFNKLMDIDPDPRISEWLSFVLFLPLGFGIAFQLPLVMLFMNRIGIFSVQVYLEKWRIAILVIFVISMLLTPADPISMLLMAMPLTVLYFLGVGLCKWMPKGRNPFSEAYEP